MLLFTENRRRSSGLSATANPRTVLSSVGLIEATEAEAEAGTLTGRYMSPLRVSQAISTLSRTRLTTSTTYNIPADFATVQAALTYLYTIDGGNNTITLQFADGSHVGGVYIRPFLGIKTLIFKGNTSNPASVIITGSGGIVFQMQEPQCSLIEFRDLKIDVNGCAPAIGIYHGNVANLDNIHWYGTGGTSNLAFATTGGTNINFNGDHQIASLGTTSSFAFCGDNGFLSFETDFIGTISGTPAFTYFLNATRGGQINCEDCEWVSGASATGLQYSLTIGGRLDLLNMTGALPGSTTYTDGSGWIRNASGVITNSITTTGAVTSSGFTISAAGPVMTSTAALTDGSAAQTPVMGTNSPVAGAPTKWLYVNDNGTFRWFPTWS